MGSAVRTQGHRLRGWKVLRWAGTLISGLVASLAALSILGVVNVHVVNSSSMQPALHTGDLLITRSTPADQVETGQVVTLTHPDGHRVTHRVLGNKPDPSGYGQLITMQGDDNDSEDPQPYPAYTVDKTLIRVPFLGGTVRSLSQPPAKYFVLGSIVLFGIASLLPVGRSSEDVRH